MNGKVILTIKILHKMIFLTRSTSKGLRVTIKSTIELSKYLLNDCGFKYVFTNNINQDHLEVILGNILLL